mmetsp:Transcript_27405/g.38107  ORF Transcript_27405/g.38107 Transcript_27405/m.38107 type:complete len:103 (+) Transcript_27405:3205-3513(+)
MDSRVTAAVQATHMTDAKRIMVLEGTTEIGGEIDGAGTVEAGEDAVKGVEKDIADTAKAGAEAAEEEDVIEEILADAQEASTPDKEDVAMPSLARLHENQQR